MDRIDIRHQEDKYLNTTGSSQSWAKSYLSVPSSSDLIRKPTTAEVDILVHEIALEFSTADEVGIRKWYCRLCYKLGTNFVRELFNRSKEGHSPAKLFSSLAKEAETHYDSKQGKGKWVRRN